MPGNVIQAQLHPPKALIRYLSASKCVLSGGSGLSMAAGMPTWSSLLAALVNEVRDEAPRRSELDDLQVLLDAGRLLDVAEFCKQALTPARYAHVLRRQIRVTGPLPEHHRI